MLHESYKQYRISLEASVGAERLQWYPWASAPIGETTAHPSDDPSCAPKEQIEPNMTLANGSSSPHKFVEDQTIATLAVAPLRSLASLTVVLHSVHSMSRPDGTVAAICTLKDLPGPGGRENTAKLAITIPELAREVSAVMSQNRCPVVVRLSAVRVTKQPGSGGMLGLAAMKTCALELNPASNGAAFDQRLESQATQPVVEEPTAQIIIKPDPDNTERENAMRATFSRLVEMGYSKTEAAGAVRAVVRKRPDWERQATGWLVDAAVEELSFV
jgi:hypothetical protein